MKKAADRAWAESHGLTLREFHKLMLTAQRKLWRGEELSAEERKVWDFAMGYPKVTDRKGTT